MPVKFLVELCKKLVESAPSTSALADLQDAEAFQRYMVQTTDFNEEETLGAVVGLIYITDLFSSSPKAKADCIAHLPDAGVQESQLDYLLAFGEELLCTELNIRSGAKESDNVIEELENIWRSFCHKRGVEVDTGFPIKYPLLPPLNPKVCFLKLYRPPVVVDANITAERPTSKSDDTSSRSKIRRNKGSLGNGCNLIVSNITHRTRADTLFPLFSRYGKVDIFISGDRRSCFPLAFVRYKHADGARKAIKHLDGEIVDGRYIFVELASSIPKHFQIQDRISSSQAPLGLAATTTVPKFFELTHMILHSHYFMCLPLENLGHNYRSFCEGRVGDEVEQVYKEAAQTKVVASSYPLERSTPLSISQLRRLLGALRFQGKGTLFRALLTARPPDSMLPHLYAVIDCTIHARVWLSGMDVNIYLDSDLTYAVLGSAGTAKVEQEVFSSIYMKERVPSCLEERQRLEAYCNTCCVMGGGYEVLALRPEDYDLLDFPENEMWQAVRKHFSYCFCYREGDQVRQATVFHQLERLYGDMFDIDRKWQALYPSLGSDQMKVDEAELQSLPNVVFHK